MFSASAMYKTAHTTVRQGAFTREIFLVFVVIFNIGYCFTTLQAGNQ